ncbi:hypothetical protein DSO57_1002755 [Entomophthora muscae]|uniref:Uncharacterized protein n=1 Tax=Entomophthora muscae TaxID=34485 RepID=A0ACC2RNK0_9FUNG|nr:hypothetical protein DSO57_1002755 [Entomophthora muscae]
MQAPRGNRQIFKLPFDSIQLTLKDVQKKKLLIQFVLVDLGLLEGDIQVIFQGGNALLLCGELGLD